MATAQRHIISESRPYQWTREEYYKMDEFGFFDDKRVELIEGEVIEMSPINSPHATSVTLSGEVLREIFGKGWVVREEKPLSFGINSDPEPDIAVVAGKIRDFEEAHPSTAALVIEVADSSLIYDRTRKATLYAKAGIADYWILNLQDRQIEVHRRPIADANAEFGFSYGDKMIFKEGDSVKPLAKPKASIEVADLLPQSVIKSKERENA
ncbi:MAG TPA: Uma2 family endonuclease [Blastocatellia bacterium]|nr:Uma2 family endonuclease [Blastocatellia bacterium]